MNSNVDQFLSHDPAEVTCNKTLTATFCYVMQSLVLNFMNFVLFQLKFLKLKSKIKFIKFELHNYVFFSFYLSLSSRPICNLSVLTNKHAYSLRSRVARAGVIRQNYLLYAHALFTATKVANQPLAMWQMIKKVGF